MRVIFRMIAAALTGLSLTTHVYALEPQRQESHASEPSITLNDYAQLPTNTREFGLLIRAFQQAFIALPYKLESSVKLMTEFPGGKFDIQYHTRTVIQLPNKFQSEIGTLDTNGQFNHRYSLVSNGEKVWIYDVANNMYSIMTPQEFDDYKDSFFMGIYPIFFTSIANTPDSQAMFEMISDLSSENLVEMMSEELQPEIPDINSELTVRNNISYTNYTYFDAKEGFTLGALVDPSTTTVDYMSVTGQHDGFDFEMEEQILSKVQIDAMPAEAFQFSPPLTAIEAEETISIDLLPQ